MLEVIFEFVTVGNFVKISAIDVDTGTEVSIMTPRNIGINTMKEQARNKLIWRLRQKSKKN